MTAVWLIEVQQRIKPKLWVPIIGGSCFYAKSDADKVVNAWILANPRATYRCVEYERVKP